MRLLPARFLPVLLFFAVPGPVTAHGTHGTHGDLPFPKLLGGGRRFLSELAASAQAEMAGSPLPTRQGYELQGDDTRQQPALRRRQVGGKDGKCGPGQGSCAAGYCCSPEGWCGLTSDYCSAPDCMINYGSGCDANQKPSGADTSGVARPHVGQVPYGGLGVYDCVNAGDIAVTFDDGPYNYTGDLLDKFASYGAKATFFITGNNLGKGMINDDSKPWPGYIRRMIADGHQVASHTWSHQNASQLTTQQYLNQILWNEIAFNDILGFFPTYMSACQKALSTLGYHVTYFDLDTEGYLNDDVTLIQNSKNLWDEAVDKANPASSKFLMIEHDIHYQTVYNLTDYVLTSLFALGYRPVTVGECLGDPKENWYRQGPAAGGGGSGGGGSPIPISTTATKGSPIPSTTIRPSHASTSAAASSGVSRPAAIPSGTPPASDLQVSTDGSCGNGITCLQSRFGNCCSEYSWCGSTPAYCAAGCQAQFGSCADTQL